MPKQDRHLGLRLGEFDVLHIHLLDLEFAVRIDLHGRCAGGKHDFTSRKAGERLRSASDGKATNLLDEVVRRRWRGDRCNDECYRECRLGGTHRALPSFMACMPGAYWSANRISMYQSTSAGTAPTMFVQVTDPVGARLRRRSGV